MDLIDKYNNYKNRQESKKVKIVSKMTKNLLNHYLGQKIQINPKKFHKNH